MAKTKRLLSLLLAAAMVLSLMPAIAFAAETETENQTEIENDSSSDSVVNPPPEDIVWEEVDYWPTTVGNFRLTKDVEVTTTNQPKSNSTTNIDLNGHKVTARTARLFTLNQGYDIYVNIYDSVGTACVEISLAGGGGVAAIGGTKLKELNIYGGTFNASGVTSSTGDGLIARADGASNTSCTINLYGGEFIGGTLGSGKFGQTFYTKNGAVLNVALKGDGKVGENAYNTNGIYPATHIACECGSKTGKHLPGCSEKKHNNWTAWTSATALPKDNFLAANGYYFLTADVDNMTFDTDNEETGRWPVGSIYLDMNGHDIVRSDGKRVLRMSAGGTNKLYLSDSVGTSVVNVTNVTGGASFALMTGDQTLTIYGGNYDMSGIQNADNNGVFVRASGAGTVNVHGGKITGGKTSAVGGVFSITGGATLNVTGGEIIGGTAGHGGAVYVEGSTSNMIMSGGEIHGGSATTSGGNVRLAAGATLTMSAGKIYDGSANNGGNINTQGGSATFNMTGGSITGGKASDRGGNFFVHEGALNVSGNAKISDGTATGTPAGNNVHINNNTNASLTVSFEGDGCIGYNSYGRHGINWVGHTDPIHIACECGSKTGEHLDGCGRVKHADWTDWDNGNGPVTSVLPANGSAVGATNGHFFLKADVNMTNLRAIAGTVYIDMNGFDITRSDGKMVFTMTSGGTNHVHFSDSVGTSEVTVTGVTDAVGFASLYCETANSTETLTIFGGKYIMSGNSVSGENKDGTFVKANGSNCTVNICGGEIIGGTNAGNGGNLAITGGATLNMTGGTVSGGTAANGGNVWVYGDSVFNLSGGEIFGGTADLGANIYVSGKATFNNSLNIEGVYISHATCVCGSPEDHLPDCNKVIYEDWKILTDGAMPNKSGRYYLLEDVNINVEVELSQDANIYVDLNGHTITAGGMTRIWKALTDGVGGTLVISDSVGTGKIEFASHVANDVTVYPGFGALAALIYGDWDFYLYGGTIDGTQTNSKDRNGAILHTRNDNVNVYIFGGEMIGSAQMDANNSGGGAIGIELGNLYMRDGLIRDGKSRMGGNIFIGANATFTMEGGSIEDGETNRLGGNIYSNGVVNIEDGTVTGGTASDEGNIGAGGNIYAEGGELTINGGLIEKGTAGKNGGNITTALTTAFTMSDGTISEGTAHNGGGNLYLDSKTCVISGGEIVGGTSNITGGNIYVASGNVKLSGGEIYDGSVDATGVNLGNTACAGNLYIAGGKVELTGGEIYDGAVIGVTDTWATNITVQAKNSFTMTGGAIYMNEGKKGNNVYITGGAEDLKLTPSTFTMTGGVIRGAQEATNVKLGWNVTMTMTGGKIFDGTVAGYGANVDVGEGATFTMTGGEIYGGNATDGGNIVGRGVNATYNVPLSSIVISGGKIYGGEASDRGGNIFAMGELNLTGDAMIYNGTAKEESTNNIFMSAAENLNADNFAGTVCQNNENGNGIAAVNNVFNVIDLPDNKHFFMASKEHGIGCVCGCDANVSLINTRFQKEFSLLFAYELEALGGSVEGLTPVAIMNGNTVELVFKTDVELGAEYVVVEVTGITAKQMSDRIQITILDENGKQIFATESYSVKAYAMSVLETDDDEAYKGLIVDMLNYGAEAQKKFGYNTGCLANSMLTAEQKVVNFDVDSVKDDRNVSKNDAAFGGSNLRFGDEINLLFRFKIDAHTYAVFAWEDHNGEKQTVELTNKDYTYSGGYYIVELENLSFADARTNVTCTIYDLNDAEVVSVNDSIASNVARNTKSTDLYYSFMKFADSASAYLHPAA